MPGHQEAANIMKQKIREASSKASHEARAALTSSKRCHKQSIDDTKPRKKAKLGRYLDASIRSNRAVAHGMATNHQFTPSAQPDQLSAQNAITVNVGASGSKSQMMPSLVAHDEINYTTDDAAVNIHRQHPTSQSSATDTPLPTANIHGLTTNADRPFALSGDQHPVGSHGTALRGSSFLINTMDGSYAGDHRPTYHNIAALRSSSFLTNPMDGSCADVQYPADTSIMASRGSSFVSNTMDGSFCADELRDGAPPNLASWGPQEFG